MPAFSRRARSVLLAVATLNCLLLLAPWVALPGQRSHAWDVSTPWLVGSLLSATALLLLALPARGAARHADVAAVVAGTLVALLGVVGLLHLHAWPSGAALSSSARTVPAATAFFTRSSAFHVPRDSVTTASGARTTGLGRAGLGVQVVLAGGLLVALRRALPTSARPAAGG